MSHVVRVRTKSAIRASQLSRLGLATLLGVMPSACVDDYSPEVLGDAGASSLEASTPVAADASSYAPALQAPPANLALGQGRGCDLTGRWILTEHRSIVVLGAKQTAFSWFYVELAQLGDRVTMSKAMSCGELTLGLPPLELRIEDESSWPALMSKLRFDGRVGTSTSVGAQCEVAFEEAVLVRGASVGTYRDPSVPLPDPAQLAEGASPGWEDWDQDGHSGLSMRVVGTLGGLIFEGSRIRSSYRGGVPRDAGSFVLGYPWEQERKTLGFEGTHLLIYEGTREPDEAQQLVELTRLTPEQATGDDAATCEAIRTLAPTLTPRASRQRL